MNLPNKITIVRLILAVIIIVILLFPFYAINIEFPTYIFNDKIVVDSRFLIAGVIFIIASLTDFLDGYLARKYKIVTDFGKFLDAIADKVLVNTALVILSAKGFIHPIIPVIVISRDIIVDSIRMIASNNGKVIAAGKAGKLKTACLMVGIALTMFYNIPFEVWNIDVANVLLIIATVLSMYSGIGYYYANKKLLFTNK
jgi:CDP-diacylglycerol--glycerol-3-phosphate 3-phosphatidyltransferase